MSTAFVSIFFLQQCHLLVKQLILESCLLLYLINSTLQIGVQHISFLLYFLIPLLKNFPFP